MSNYIIPMLVLFVVLYALFKKVDIYDSFVIGATESFGLVFKLFPCLLGMLLGVNVLLASNVIFDFFSFITFIPTQIIPMMLMRPISGTSSLAILTNIYEVFGTDGFIGYLASLIQGSTDTTFYVLTLYFGSVGIKKIRYAMFVGLFADFIAIVVSVIVCNILF